MAIKKSETTETQENIVQQPESLYHKTELIAGARAIFGVSPEVVAGALYNDESGADGQGNFTKREVQNRIDKFLRKKV